MDRCRGGAAGQCWWGTALVLFGGWAAAGASCGVSQRMAQGKPPTANGWQAGRWLAVRANAVLACRRLQAEADAKLKAKEDLKAFLLSNEVNKKVGGGGRAGQGSVGCGRVGGHRGWFSAWARCLPLPAAVGSSTTLCVLMPCRTTHPTAADQGGGG